VGDVKTREGAPQPPLSSLFKEELELDGIAEKLITDNGRRLGTVEDAE
jgi:hypothetical protein